MKNLLNPTKKENYLKEKMDKFDIFIFAAEDSADIFGYNLIQELLSLNSKINILCVAGPRMRTTKIKTLLKMENFQVMGFIDIIFALPKLIKNFIFVRNSILKYNPKVCIFIDYPDFNLLLEKSLRKKGFKNKLIHYVAPTVWAWRKKRADFMAKHLDILISIFPFEKNFFSHTNLDVRYIGHPIAYEISQKQKSNYSKDLIGIFPGSRRKEIERNFPYQLNVSKKLLQQNKTLQFAISVTNKDLIDFIFKKYHLNTKNFIFFKRQENYYFMQKLKLAFATSGTITLELALNKIPTIVNYAITPLDLFIAKKLIKINLPYYCIANIIANKQIFYELYGPNLSVENLYNCAKKFLFNDKIKNNCIENCKNLIKLLGNKNSNKQAANIIFSLF